MVRYIKCPRCELNYIDGETQEYCDVCKAEMLGNKLQFADLEEEFEDLEMEQGELCPVCGVNYVPFGEKMCEECRNKFDDYEEEEEPLEDDKDEEWNKYLEDDDEQLSIDEEELDKVLREEFDGEFDDEESEDIDYYEDDEEFEDDFDDSDLDEDYDDDYDDDEDDDDDDF